MNPNMDRGDRQKRVEACRNALPSDHQAAILLLEPGKRPLSLESWHHFFDRSATIFLGLPDALRELCPDPPFPELLPERFGIIAFIRRNDLKAFARTAAVAGANLDRIK